MNREIDPENESTPDEEAPDARESDDDYEHLKSLDDGVGCTEIWEHLSESRDD